MNKCYNINVKMWEWITEDGELMKMLIPHWKGERLFYSF